MEAAEAAEAAEGGWEPTPAGHAVVSGPCGGEMSAPVWGLALGLQHSLVAAAPAECVERQTAERQTVDEYYALRDTMLVKNFDGIAAASHEKPKRRVDDDAHVDEEPFFREGGDADVGSRPDGGRRRGGECWFG